ncbi:hypothetical protein AFL01nite_19320 [Aeromicrobium flavum]|uniref:Uncharacterized protein n=1 Tax=Aeromicrobium flavum TaxID=416568 RepID=A0A512HW02_9ACTN|nr:hypothetical protein AFL01nite_19320 [Aeromicrobium flavum]
MVDVPVTVASRRDDKAEGPSSSRIRAASSSNRARTADASGTGTELMLDSMA